MFEKAHKRALPLFEWKPVKIVTIRHHAIKSEQNISAQNMLNKVLKIISHITFQHVCSKYRQD